MHRQEAQALALQGFSGQFTLSHWPRLLSYSRCFRPTITETDQSNLTSALGHPPTPTGRQAASPLQSMHKGGSWQKLESPLLAGFLDEEVAISAHLRTRPPWGFSVPEDGWKP